MDRYCTNCGKPLPEGANGCPDCNPAMQEPIESYEVPAPSAPFEFPAPPVDFAPPAPPRKGKKVKWWMIVAPIVALLLVAAILVGIFWRAILLRVWPTSILAKALVNTVSDMNDRSEGTLGQTFAGIVDEDGLYTTRVDMALTYGARLSKATADFSITGASDTKNNRMFMTMDGSFGVTSLYVFGGNVDVDAALYVDGDCAALNWEQVTGDRYYGVVYDTFEEDVSSNEMLSSAMDEDTRREIGEMLRSLSEALEPDGEEEPFQISEEYVNILVKFLLERKAGVDTEQIRIQNETLDCDLITYTLSDKDMGKLFNDLLAVAREDEGLKDYLSGLEESGDPEGDTLWEQILAECGDAFEKLEDSDGVSTLSFYLKGDYAVQITWQHENDQDFTDLTLVLGENAGENDILLRYNWEKDGETGGLEMVFTRELDENTVSEGVSIAVFAGDDREEYGLSYVWDRTSGDLVVDIVYEMDGEPKETRLNMSLYEKDGGIVLVLPEMVSTLEALNPELVQDLAGSTCEMTLAIYPGAVIIQPDFVNIRELTREDVAGFLKNMFG